MKPTFGLRAALSFLVLIAIAPVFAVVVRASLSEQQSRLERAQAELRAVVNLGAAHQERLIDGARQVLAAIAYSPAVHGDDRKACADYMRRLQSQYPMAYGTFGVLDENGGLTCRSTPSPTTVNSSDRLFFRAAVATRRFSVGEYTVSRASSRPVLTFGLPVLREHEPALRGVAYLALDLARADEILGKLALPSGVTLLVTDRAGMVLAATGSREVRVGQPVPEGFLRQAVAAGKQQFSRAEGAGGSRWFYAVEPVGRVAEGQLFVAGMVSEEQVLAPASQRLRQQLIALGLIALAAALVAWAFGDRVVARPVGRLLERVDALAREEVPQGTPVAGGALRELSDLGTRFDRLARLLAERSVQRDGAMVEMAGQNRLLESILESMAEGVFVLDDAGRFIHVNAAARRILPGITETWCSGEAIQMPFSQWGIYHLDGTTPLAPCEDPAHRVLAGENIEDFRYTVRGQLSHGHEKIIRGHARTLVYPQGTQYGAVVVFADVTAEHRAAEVMKESEKRYRELFESNPHPMWLFDLETLHFLEVNDAAVSQYGYTRDEFLSMRITDIRPPEEVGSLGEALADARKLHEAAPFRHLRKDGSVVCVEISSHTLDYAGRPARMVLASDVTPRVLAQEALQQLNETLERRVAERTRELAVSNHELESFAYSVSHDLRAPLQVIDGFGKALLSRNLAQLDERARHYLARIRENTRQMGTLIDDLLSLARVTRTELRHERTDLAVRARQVVERLRLRDPDREVDVRIDDRILCTGDPGLLGIVLENLIENAWKFTARIERPEIRVGSRRRPEGQQVIYVSDNGAGFEMAYVDKLFKAFQRLHASSDFHGTGIGLATVHRIVVRHGGRVWAEGVPGEGAVFQFTLKGEQDEEQQDPAGGGQPRPPGAHLDDAGREQCAQ